MRARRGYLSRKSNSSHERACSRQQIHGSTCSGSAMHSGHESSGCQLRGHLLLGSPSCCQQEATAGWQSGLISCHQVPCCMALVVLLGFNVDLRKSLRCRSLQTQGVTLPLRYFCCLWRPQARPQRKGTRRSRTRGEVRWPRRWKTAMPCSAPRSPNSLAGCQRISAP